MAHAVTLIPGDGIGPEVADAKAAGLAALIDVYADGRALTPDAMVRRLSA